MHIYPVEKAIILFLPKDETARSHAGIVIDQDKYLSLSELSRHEIPGLTYSQPPSVESALKPQASGTIVALDHKGFPEGEFKKFLA
jgi:hypothetical protein